MFLQSLIVSYFCFFLYEMYYIFIFYYRVIKLNYGNVLVIFKQFECLVSKLKSLSNCVLVVDEQLLKNCKILVEDNDENNYGVLEYDVFDFVEEEVEFGQFVGGEIEVLRRFVVFEKEVGKDLFWLNVFLKEIFVVEIVYFFILVFKVNIKF